MSELSSSPLDAPKVPQKGEGYGITFRSVFAALIFVILINALSGFNSDELGQAGMVSNFMPLAVYFSLFLLAFVWNGIFSKLLPALVFSKRETAAFFILVLIGSWSPNSGLYRYFNRQIISPVFNETTQPSWKKYGITDLMPEKLFPLGGDMEAPAPDLPHRAEGVIPASGDAVYSGFVQGLFLQSESVSGGLYEMSEILTAWLEPMKYWGGLIVVMMLMILSLSFLLHRQWSRYEQLSYPLAGIASSMIERDAERPLSRIFYSKLFWAGFITVSSIYIINFGHAWYTSEIPSIPLKWNMDWSLVFPGLKESNSLWNLNRGAIFFTLIGVCYFCSVEVSFTLGLSSVILAIFTHQFYLATGDPFNKNDLDMTRAGAYVAYGLMLAWAGRNYYLRIFGKAVGVGKHDPELDSSVWAARYFLLFTFTMVWFLNAMGMDAFVAILFTGSHLLMFTIMTRIVCESGVPFLQPFINLNSLGMVFTKLCGPAMMGAKPMVLFTWFGSALAQDPREALMPFVSNGLKISETFKLKLRRFVIAMVAFLIIGVTVGFVATSYNSYKYGAQKDGYAWGHVAKKEIDKTVQPIAFLEDTQQREVSDNTHGFAKLKLLDPDAASVELFTFGLIAVMILFFLKFRFPGFWIHPLLFIVWGTYPITFAWTSYFIGWIIKTLVVKFGGGRVYQDLKPLFIGLILGELVVGGISILVGFAYYGSTGLTPVRFSILPG